MTITEVAILNQTQVVGGPGNAFDDARDGGLSLFKQILGLNTTSFNQQSQGGL
jgi:hypothetical protein